MPKKVNHSARRAELAAALFSVVERDGMDGVTIRSVAAEAGWTRGVIAHYFTSRDDLLLFAYREGIARTRENWAPGPGMPALDVLRDWLLLTLPLDRDSALNHAIYLGFAGSATRRPDLAAAVESENEEFDGVARDLLMRCVDEGVLAPPVPTDLAAELLVTFVDGLGLNAVMSPERYSPGEVRRALDAFLEAWRRPCVL